MTPINPTSMQDRTRRILGDLEAVRENLLALSDDIWLSIDHNDCEALEEGVQFKRTYNEKMAAFDRFHISNRGHRGFSRNREELRSAGEIGEGIFAEVHGSANDLRDSLRQLLATFEIPLPDLRLFLREDRDAARDRGGA